MDYFFDLDEVVTPELEKEIIEVTNSQNTAVGYFVKRNFFFLGKK